MTPKPTELKGGALNLSVAISQEFSRAIVKLMDKMQKEAKRELRKVFETVSMDSVAMDDSISSQARIMINKLRRKYDQRFSEWAKTLTAKMIRQVEKNSAVTLGMSLKQISEHATISTAGLMTDRIQDIIKASTEEAANLIKTIPQQYLNDVHGAVMRSITTGRGLKDLIPFMNEKYNQNVRKARSAALDQTRKAYNNLNAGRMQALGIEEFEWIHSGGGKEPREQHKEWNGKRFKFDALPIDDQFGPVIPGQAINCRCSMRPILSFGEQ